ncbi:MAG: ATP-binding protein [Chitinivibrionales bacterium]|nr:ATP-binding protein [Chitinivibrionales bacterium]
MPKHFYNRSKEIDILNRFVDGPAGKFAVIYGRRRCGKSTLIQKILTSQDIYFLADIREPKLQIRAFAQEVSKKIEKFDEVDYPSWEVLLSQLNSRVTAPFTLVVDEYPYLEQMEPGLSSTLQNFIDRGIRFNLIICGSSQRLMQGLILDSRAPLFGRAQVIIKVRPLEPGWITDALGVGDSEAVERYSVWGGVPRYWELANDFPDHKSALLNLIYDRNGVLHDEPRRILLDDLRTSGQPNSILSLIASGCHRLSEISARLGKPAASLSRPLEVLLELGYIRREIPFGESIRSTKRSLYQIDDPFLLHWYKFVEPNRSVLERDLANQVYTQCQPKYASHVSTIWEQLARLSTSTLSVDGIQWKPANRFWGNTIEGQPVEIDVVAESFDTTRILIAEVKWQREVDVEAEFKRLEQLAPKLPHIHDRPVSIACWVPDATFYKNSRHPIIDAHMVMNALR